MAAGTALKKITARVKALKKKHPGAKYKSLQKQAGKEYKAGKLKAKRKPAKRKPAKRKVARRKVSAVGAVRRRKVTRRKAPRRKKVARARVIVIGAAPKRRRRRATRRKAAAPRRRRVGSTGTNTALIVGGIAVLALGAYFLLKPSSSQTSYIPTANPVRNNQANQILTWATAAGMGIAAITSLISALNSKSDNEVAALHDQAQNTDPNDWQQAFGISGIGCYNGVGALSRQIG